MFLDCRFAAQLGGRVLLAVKLDLARINSAQADYLALGTRRGTHFAARVMALRNAFQHASRRFGERQSAEVARSGRPLLADGTQQTLDDEVFGPMAAQGWPKRSAAILHGLHLPATPLLPAAPCCPGGRDLADLDGDSYLTRLDDGPPQQRALGDTKALVIYLAPFAELRVFWMGAEADCVAAIAALSNETGSWTDLRPVAQDYADWLAQACQAASTN